MWKFFTAQGAEKRAAATVNKPIVKLRRNTDINLTSVWTAILFEDMLWNPGSEFSLSGGYAVIPRSGRYRFSFQASSGGVPADLAVRWRTAAGTIKSDAEVYGFQTMKGIGLGGGVYSYDDTFECVAGEQIGIEVYHTGGSTTFHGFTMTIEYVDPAVVSFVGVPGSLVGQELAYVERTDANAGASVTGTSFATGSVLFTTPSITFDGTTKVLVETFLPRNGKGTSWLEVNLGIDGANQGILGYVDTALQPFRGGKMVTPSAGAHNFSIVLRVDAGTGNWFGGPGTGAMMVPAWMRVMRVA